MRAEEARTSVNCRFWTRHSWQAPAVSKHRSKVASLKELLSVVLIVVGLTCITWVLWWVFASDWPTARLFVPAYGTALLALGGLVQMVLASTASRGERRDERPSSWVESLGWAAIGLGSGLAAVVPIFDLVQSV